MFLRGTKTSIEETTLMKIHQFLFSQMNPIQFSFERHDMHAKAVNFIASPCNIPSEFYCWRLLNSSLEKIYETRVLLEKNKLHGKSHNAWKFLLKFQSIFISFGDVVILSHVSLGRVQTRL